MEDVPIFSTPISPTPILPPFCQLHFTYSHFVTILSTPISPAPISSSFCQLHFTYSHFTTILSTPISPTPISLPFYQLLFHQPAFCLPMSMMLLRFCLCILSYFSVNIWLYGNLSEVHIVFSQFLDVNMCVFHYAFFNEIQLTLIISNYWYLKVNFLEPENLL